MTLDKSFKTAYNGRLYSWRSYADVLEYHKDGSIVSFCRGYCSVYLYVDRACFARKNVE